MRTISLIRRYISLLPTDQLFTTRAVLRYGSRTAVDSALFRLVQSGRIRRVVRGVFIRDDYDRSHQPTVHEVARVKAESFGRQLACHGRQAAIQLGLLMDNLNETYTYAIRGHSSSFKFNDLTIHFKKVSERMMRAGDSKSGLVIRALWHLGFRACNRSTALQATASFNREDRSELHRLAGYMTAWMVDCFNWPVRCPPDLMRGRPAAFP